MSTREKIVVVLAVFVAAWLFVGLVWFNRADCHSHCRRMVPAHSSAATR